LQADPHEAESTSAEKNAHDDEPRSHEIETSGAIVGQSPIADVVPLKAPTSIDVTEIEAALVRAVLAGDHVVVEELKRILVRRRARA
jgi:predicted MarR family transcription regulator